MGGSRGDGKLLESLQRAADYLYQNGQDELSEDVSEAIVRLKPIYDGKPPKEAE